MANRGWPSEAGGGSSMASNARTTGRVAGSSGDEAFIKGSSMAAPGMENDPLDTRGDLAEIPGNLSTC